MSLNDTAGGERVHIGFFGLRNAGKSSVVNAVTGQKLSVVSSVKGTTTDPVRKSMELLPVGPVVIVDTPGFDDVGELGEMRVAQTKRVLRETDVAVLVCDGETGLRPADRELIGLFRDHETPFILAWNKTDLDTCLPAPEAGEGSQEGIAAGNVVPVSGLTGDGIFELKERIGAVGKPQENQRQLIGDLVKPGDTAVLVIPIDKAAPKGRLILPEQQMIRALLDAGAAAVVCRNTELAETLAGLKKKPALVITDSQAFREVAEIVPEDIPLTSFSILFARYKGDLLLTVRGAAALRRIHQDQKVLIAEGCTHHRQCGDIGTIKLPALMKKYRGFPVNFDTVSGRDFPEDLSPYALVLHCGGCMLNAKEMQSRQQMAVSQEVPITNYGVAIAEMNGILERSLSLFPEALRILRE